MAKTVKDSVFFLSQRVPGLAPTKSQRRKAEILEAAVKVFAKEGIEAATYEKIGKQCGVTGPLVQHYFPTKEVLFETAVQYVRGNFQDLAVEAITKAAGARAGIESYVRSTFRWVEKFPAHARLWVLFYFHCSHRPKYRKLNTLLVGMGHQRIAALIELGTARGEFRGKDFLAEAKVIQCLVTGALITLGTEDLPMPESRFEDSIVEECLAVIGAKAR